MRQRFADGLCVSIARGVVMGADDDARASRQARSQAFGPGSRNHAYDERNIEVSRRRLRRPRQKIGFAFDNENAQRAAAVDLRPVVVKFSFARSSAANPTSSRGTNRR